MNKHSMKHKALRVFKLLSLGAVVMTASCPEPPIGLDSYCPDDPTVDCPRGDCGTVYPCVSYCVRNHPEGGSVPDSGMGSWCDDSRVTDYGEWCREHPAIVGCEEWCAAHDDACDGGGDGDSDVDGDGDADGDADPDEEPDIDMDSDPDPEPECREHEDCERPEAARCLDGVCVACGGDEHCTHVPGLQACEAGVCHECTADNDDACVGAMPYCDTTGHECVECLEHDQCEDAAASRCDGTTFTCEACDDDAQCAHVPDLPACDGGTC